MRYSKILALIAGLVLLVVACGGSEAVTPQFETARGVGTLSIDMDDFKSVNDAFGHQEGDELLILTALTISSQLRNADVAAR